MPAKEKSLEEIVWLIAKAFLRQRYPLSALGLELKQEVAGFVAAGSVPVGYIDILPTVENLRTELFCDFDLTLEQEREVFGWDLSVVQTSKGCTHQCLHCYKNAEKRLSMMPFAAVVKIAHKKLLYEKKAANEWIEWEKYLRDHGTLDTRKFWLPTFLRKASKSEIDLFASIIRSEWDSFSPRIIKTRPYPEKLPLKELKKEYMRCVPINWGCIHSANFSYNDNDPLDYRDLCFLHKDGSPADYGDVFEVMTGVLRPITVSTAGWFKEDKIACRAMSKVIEICKKDPLVSSKMHRLSVSLCERHAEADMVLYIEEVIRMIREAAPIEMFISIYYDKGDDKRRYIAYLISDMLLEVVEDELGYKDKIMLTPISFGYGRAVDLRRGDDYENWDPDMGIDGVHIMPNGEVKKKPDFIWDSRIRKNGQKQYFLRAPEGSVPEPTGLWLYKLKGSET